MDSRSGSWAAPYRRGIRHLSRHENRQALRELRRAVELCPPLASRELATLLYYLGMALERSGEPSLAATSWVNARRLVRCGRVARGCDRWVNGYGMRRQATPLADDYRAFESIQIGRYLASRVGGRFHSAAERDAVRDLILDAWKPIARLRGFPALGITRKVALFRAARVDLPFFCVEDALAVHNPPIAGNFRRRGVDGVALTPESRCSCASGRSYGSCCGRLTDHPSR